MAFLRHCHIWMSLIAMLLPPPGMPASSRHLPQEYAVKAAYLVSLFSYVDWPPGQDQHKTICVVGRDPFGQLLERTVIQFGSAGIDVRRR